MRFVFMQQLTLYSKPGCHLCEEAADLLRQALQGRDVHVEEVDISRDVDLMQRYSTLIPVIARPDTGAQCQWPFGPADVLALLDNNDTRVNR